MASGAKKVVRTDPALLADVRRLATALGRCVEWPKSRFPVSGETSFVFELYILLRLVRALCRAHSVEFVPGTGRTRLAFPAAPADKAGRPRFQVRSEKAGKIAWQLCAGTKIHDTVGDKRAADVSLQSGDSPEGPTFKDVHLIWDGKWRTDPDGRVTDAEFSKLARWIEVFNLRGKSIPKLDLGDLRELLSNCLITNGLASTETPAARRAAHLREVQRFAPGLRFKVEK